MQTLFASLLAVVTMAINAQSWKTTLPDMLFGMIGIFIVIGAVSYTHLTLPTNSLV